MNTAVQERFLEPSSLVARVQRFRALRALVLGDVMLDSYLEGNATRLCSEGPVPVIRKTSEARLPGGAANTAANLQALGAEVRLVGLAGADATGQLLRSSLRAQGVDDGWLVEDEHLTTLHKLRILADGQYVVRFDDGDTEAPSTSSSARLVSRLAEALEWCDVVVVSDYAYGVVSTPLLERVVEWRRRRPCPLVVDSKDLARYQGVGATVITPNHLEAQLLASPGSVPQPDAGLELIERVGREIRSYLGVEHVIVTMGKRGVCLVEESGDTEHLAAHPTAQAHDVGAGDSFTAGLALALAAGAGCREAARIGLISAGIAVTKPRTAVVNHRELLQRVSLVGRSAEGRGSERGLDDLRERLRFARLTGQTVVFTNGIFDILHAGHVDFLRQARQLGDLLVVGINSDRSALAVCGSRPFNRQEDRLALVSALDSVDHALLFDEQTPEQLIQALGPHVHVKGGDYAGQPLPEAEAVAAAGGRVVILPLSPDDETPGLIERLLLSAAGGN
jgi:D-beta-D-heptose 7-phosphate kinase/D-beta-D-heptose 1-phosphate adenosyltransferase